MSKNIKLEVLIAWPPTSKCKETVDILEEVVRCHPDQLMLLVFKRGIDFHPEGASSAMQCLIQKSSPIPACVVNGLFFSSRFVPNLEELETTVKKALRNTDSK